MYESPIKLDFTEPVLEELKDEADQYIVRACQKMNVDVDREELIRALQYDRDQYIKGYIGAVEELTPRLDSLQEYFDRITALPDCNTCLKKDLACEFRPKPGQHTRINCPLYLGFIGREDKDG